jgi:hypothetical protein
MDSSHHMCREGTALFAFPREKAQKWGAKEVITGGLGCFAVKLRIESS